MLLACVLGVGCTLLPVHGLAGGLAAAEPLPDGGETPGVWRTTSHEGANCLYLLLLLSGRKADYGDVTAAIHATNSENSLAGLREAAQRLGLDTTVYRWQPHELAHAPCPVIAFVDNYDGEGGYFALIFQTTDANCSLVTGPNATFVDLRAEDFRQVWSGYVLAPTQPTRSQTPELLSSGAGVLILAAYGWLRARRVLATPVDNAQSQVA
jgi:hypothetical protein